LEEAIRGHEMSRRTLGDLVTRHGKLVSRMARLQGAIGLVDFNLMVLYESNPAKYAAARRAKSTAAYDICEKLSLVQPLSWNLKVIYATTSLARADFQAEDGLRPDVGLLLNASRIWDGMLRKNPKDSFAQAGLVVVRRRLAGELADRGQFAEAAEWSRRSLESARGDTEILHELAATYAQEVDTTGTYPTRLNADQLRERRRRFVEGAVAMFRQAVADGFKDAGRLRGDSTFDPLRSEPGFAAIVADLASPADPFTTP
jgi:hypothetical protein